MTMQGMGSIQGFWNLLTPHEQGALVALGRDKKYSPGANLCVQGDPATHVFVLVDGWVKLLSVTDDGHEGVLALRGDGDIVGEAAGGTTGQRKATIKAIGVVHALIVGNERFSSLRRNRGRRRTLEARATRRAWNVLRRTGRGGPANSSCSYLYHSG
jgi:CRP-like cAMP-binding protein